MALVNNTTLINFGGMGASSRFSETSILSHPWRHIADVTAASCTCAWAVTVPSAVSKVLDQRDSGLQGGPSTPPKFCQLFNTLNKCKVISPINPTVIGAVNQLCYIGGGTFSCSNYITVDDLVSSCYNSTSNLLDKDDQN